MNWILKSLCAALLIFSAGCASTNSAFGTGGPSARIAATEPPAEIWKSGQWRKARRSQSLHQGEAIRTGSSGSVKLDFGDFGGIAHIQPESEVWIQQFGWTNQPSGRTMLVLLDLRAGRISGDTLKPSPSSRFMVRTAGGTFELK